MSDTPRTDAAVGPHFANIPDQELTVSVLFAKQLERELATAKAQLEEATEMLRYSTGELGSELLRLRAELATAKAQLEEAGKINTSKRLFDLVRYMRSELHTAELITDEEYEWLLSGCPMATGGGSPSARRLEDYDAIRADNARLQAELEQASIELSKLRSVVNLEPHNTVARLQAQVAQKDAALQQVERLLRGFIDAKTPNGVIYLVHDQVSKALSTTPTNLVRREVLEQCVEALEVLYEATLQSTGITECYTKARVAAAAELGRGKE